MFKYCLFLITSCVPFILCANTNPKNTFQQIQIHEVEDLDRIWEAYFAHPNPAYIQQFLKLINEDEEVMWFAYEYLNRLHNAEVLSRLQKKHVAPNLDNIKKSIARREKQKKGFTYQIVLAMTAMYSLNQQVRSNPQVNKDFKALVNANPNWDYGKKIQAMLGQ